MIDIAWIVFGSFVFAFLFLLFNIIIQKIINSRDSKKHGWARDYIFSKYFDYEDIKRPTSNRFFFDAFIEAENQVLIEQDIRKSIIEDIMVSGFCKSQFRRIDSRSVIKRKIASFYLGALQNDYSIETLKKRLFIEKNESVKFYIIYALKKHLDQESISQIIGTFEGASDIYRRWIYTLLSNNFNTIKPYLMIYSDIYTPEIRDLLLYLAKKHTDDFLKDYALKVFDQSYDNLEIQNLALDALVITHPEELAKPLYFN